MFQAESYFRNLIEDSKKGTARSICSVCSSNAFVIEAALEEGRRTHSPVLIEATANQVNQFGGYTGMQPADFVSFVSRIAQKIGFDLSQLILGGDHLGPLVWSSEPAEEAMKKAEVLIAAFAKAGFQKIHLDCSMRLGGDDPSLPLPVATVAQRTARLAKIAEANAPQPPVYVVGSEVPIPGGATEAEEGLSVTSKEALLEEHQAFKEAFDAAGLSTAWQRTIAIVVQPGVEFGDDQVFLYDRQKALSLTQTAKTLEGIVLEGHSTDYQPESCLQQMREDQIVIQKVGPALTFALRSGLFALEHLERAQYPQAPAKGYSNFSAVLEEEMLCAPANWIRHYHGNDQQLALMRKYSLSDRCRYYLDRPRVDAAIKLLLENVNASPLSFGLLYQYFPRQAESIIAGKLDKSAEALLKEQVCYILRTYA
jgi:D-tagatose-1,6-bisphosphate aldolase subunit GatZ/KbaZ